MFRIRSYRPRSFGEIVGQENARAVRRLQQAARERSWVPSLLLGPYGCGKSSLARLVMQSYACASPDPETADPCQKCEGCLRTGVAHNGEFHNGRHWEIDCTRGVGRKEVAEVVAEAEQESGAALFFDELTRLGEAAA